MLGPLRMVFMALSIIFVGHSLFKGSRLSAPSWQIGRYGMMSTRFLTCFLLLVKHGCTVWIFQYAATYAKACSLRPTREPFIWSWTCKSAASGEEEASCMLRRAPTVIFSSGEHSLLSYRYVWPGVSALSLTNSLVYNSMLLETAGGNGSSRYEMMFKMTMRDLHLVFFVTFSHCLLWSWQCQQLVLLTASLEASKERAWRPSFWPAFHVTRCRQDNAPMCLLVMVTRPKRGASNVSALPPGEIADSPMGLAQARWHEEALREIYFLACASASFCTV